MKNTTKLLLLLMVIFCVNGKENGARINKSNNNGSSVTLFLSPVKSSTNANATTQSANTYPFGYLYSWSSDNGVLVAAAATAGATNSTTSTTTATTFRECARKCHGKGAQGGLFVTVKSSCLCVISQTTPSSCRKASDADKGGRVFSIHSKPSSCNVDVEQQQQQQQQDEQLQLLPDFQLAFTFDLPPPSTRSSNNNNTSSSSSSSNDHIALTKSDEQLMTRRIQLHLQDVFNYNDGINNINVTAYMHMKKSNSYTRTSIARQFSGFLKFSQPFTLTDDDVNKITYDAFQPNNIHGAQFIVNLHQDAVNVNVNADQAQNNSSTTATTTTTTASILLYLYNYSYSTTSDNYNDDNVLLMTTSNNHQPTTLHHSIFSTPPSTIAIIASLCGAFALGLIIGGLLLIIQFNRGRHHHHRQLLQIPYDADGSLTTNKQPPHRNLDLNLNYPHWEPPPYNKNNTQHHNQHDNNISIRIMASSSSGSSRSVSDDNYYHSIEEELQNPLLSSAATGTANVETPISDELQCITTISTSITSIAEKKQPPEHVIIHDGIQDDSRTVLVDAAPSDDNEQGAMVVVDDYYLLLGEDNDGSSDDDIINDGSSIISDAHPSVCSLEKIIVNAKVVAASSQVVISLSSSSASSSEASSKRIRKGATPTTPDEYIKQNNKISVAGTTGAASSTLFVSPSSVMCSIMKATDAVSNNNNDVDGHNINVFEGQNDHQKENSNATRFFESVWNELDDESLQSYIPRIIHIPSFNLSQEGEEEKEQEEKDLLPPQIQRHHAENEKEFVLLPTSSSRAGKGVVPHVVDITTTTATTAKVTDTNTNSDDDVRHDCSRSLFLQQEQTQTQQQQLQKKLDNSIQHEPLVSNESNLYIFGITNSDDDDSDKSGSCGVMFSSISYQSSFIHGSIAGRTEHAFSCSSSLRPKTKMNNNNNNCGTSSNCSISETSSNKFLLHLGVDDEHEHAVAVSSSLPSITVLPCQNKKYGDDDSNSSRSLASI